MNSTNDMDLQTFIEEFNLDKLKVARKLFPKNKHPMMALSRLIKGKSEMTVSQLKILSNIVGFKQPEILDPNVWKTENSYAIHSKGFTAVLDFESFETRVYDKDKILIDVVLHSSSIVLSEYIEKINSLISKK